MGFFFLLAVFGFCVSLVVHLSTFSSRPVLMSRSWPLHVGIFLVFVPMIIWQKKWGDPATFKKGGSAGSFFKLIPKWMRMLSNLVVYYVIVNFVLFAIFSFGEEREGKWRTENGQHVVMRDGKIVRVVGEQEYQYHEARVARGFSGLWLIFYGAAAVGLYDAMVRRRLGGGLCVPGVTQALMGSGGQQFIGRSPRLSIFTHSIMARLAGGFGFLAGPICVFLIFMPVLHAGSRLGGCVFVPIFFGSGIVGAVVVSLWFERWIAGCCPSCGGRAIGKAQSRADGGGMVYHCRDCGAEHAVR